MSCADLLLDIMRGPMRTSDEFPEHVMYIAIMRIVVTARVEENLGNLALLNLLAQATCVS